MIDWAPYFVYDKKGKEGEKSMSKKALIVYFTTTGNTQMLAESIEEGLELSGAEVVLKNVSDATSDEVTDYDLIALGCPAQGTEELDDTEFGPYFEETLPNLEGKNVILFGCYGWGDGEFMETWKEMATEGGVNVVETYINLETPDQDALDEAKALGERFAAI